METIIILALVFFFVGLRLYSVLGKRTGHEQQPIAKPVDAKPSIATLPRTLADAKSEPVQAGEPVVDARARDGLRQLVAADPQFDVTRFLDGAKSAYRMILEAYWAGDEATLEPLVAPDVRAAFVEAIADRRDAGHVLDNRLVSIECATIDGIAVQGPTATIVVRFEADIAAVTRDAEQTVIAGSVSDAVTTQDVWTFARTMRASDPNWILIETDEAA